MTDPNPCGALGCAIAGEPIEICKKYRCPYRWQRAGREDRAAQAVKDLAASTAAPGEPGDLNPIGGAA